MSRSIAQAIWQITIDEGLRAQELDRGYLAEILPERFFTIRLLGVELWQWLGFLAVTLLALVVSWIVTWFFHRAARRLISRAKIQIAGPLEEVTVRPVRYGLALAVFALATRFLNLSSAALVFLSYMERVLTIAVVTWLVLRITQVASERIEEHLKETEQKAALALLPWGRRSVKGVLVVLALVGVFQNLGFDVTGVLAGLGVGGIAVALAAQKSIENLFGGLTLTLDQPVRVGDFCKFGDRMGTVEDVGIRSTRVRTLDRTLISIPNSDFSQTPIENFGVRDRIRIYNTLGLRYETTPDQLRYLLTGLRKLLYAHPKVEAETARVRFVGFGAYSLDVELFAYALTSDWAEFLAVREDLFLRMMDIVEESGTSFAFPSQTTYLCRDQGLDQEACRAAEARVKEWRQRQELPFPALSDEVKSSLKDTLDYPPVGSVWEAAKRDEAT